MRSAERHYDTMTLEQIKALPVDRLAADDCALFLWCVKPELPGALEGIKAWGFDYTSIAFSWVKTNASAQVITLDGQGLHTGLGYWTRANPEICILAMRGRPQRLAMDVHEVIIAPVGEHSQKPAEIYNRIERLVAGPYLELFARSERPGWTRWGNELPVDRYDPQDDFAKSIDVAYGGPPWAPKPADAFPDFLRRPRPGS